MQIVLVNQHVENSLQMDVRKKNIRIQTGNINTDEVGKKHTYQMIDELFSRLLQKSKNVDAEDQNCI